MQNYIAPIRNQEYWLQRAEEWRALAEQTRNSEVKRHILTVAETYEVIAGRATAQAQATAPG
jgi:hypothetical protein